MNPFTNSLRSTFWVRLPQAGRDVTDQGLGTQFPGAASVCDGLCSRKIAEIIGAICNHPPLGTVTLYAGVSGTERRLITDILLGRKSPS